ncbi:MAG: aminotransferase class I/II-fold pyridoxal phosphate-dependent enzyme [Candidatus Pacebacteria bacterium]|nr:aminotransferase class I/II-fold pyridoxal phosphate-dependent enzyme [Candidatus Paceibacterota bacterium]
MEKIKIPLNKASITQKDFESFKPFDLKQGIAEFENSFKNYIGREFALATSSGTAALHLALLSLEVGENDEVVCPSYTCAAILNALNYVKAKAILIDCNFNVKNNDFNLLFDDLKNKITKNCKAVIVPHAFGFPAQIDKIISLGIPVIEDATQSLGGSLDNKKLGSFGEVSVFSFHQSKMMTTGEGGMLLTDSEDLFKKAEFLCNYEATLVSQRTELKPKYSIQYNYMMNPLGALLGLSQLRQLDDFIEKRRRIAEIYTNELKNKVLAPIEFNNNVFWRYIIETENPKAAIEKAKDYEIELGRGVYPALHQLIGINPLDFPNTEKALSSLMALPIYPSLKEQEIDYLLKALKKIL